MKMASITKPVSITGCSPACHRQGEIPGFTATGADFFELTVNDLGTIISRVDGNTNHNICSSSKLFYPYHCSSEHSRIQKQEGVSHHKYQEYDDWLGTWPQPWSTFVKFIKIQEMNLIAKRARRLLDGRRHLHKGQFPVEGENAHFNINTLRPIVSPNIIGNAACVNTCFIFTLTLLRMLLLLLMMLMMMMMMMMMMLMWCNTAAQVLIRSILV